MAAKSKLSKDEQAQQELVERYGTMGRDAGCPRDQMELFLMAGLILQKKQLEFAAKCRECDKPNGPKKILNAGGRGSGKTSTILSVIFADDCQRVKGLKVLVLRKVGKANREQIQDFRTKLLHSLPHEYREQRQEITFKNGSRVILGNFQTEGDIDAYLGIEYDLIYVMECNQLTSTKLVNIESCLRTNKTNWRPRLYLDTNPGGISHVNQKKIFIDGKWQRQGDGYVKIGDEGDTRYHHSTVDDNKFVNVEYKSYLETLVGWQREAWLYGSWEFLAGAFFSNFNQSVHVYPNEQTDLNPRSITRWFAGFDYGMSHLTTFILGCEDENGNIFIPAIYGAANTLIEEHSANIRDMLSLFNLTPEELEFIAAGKDCFRVDKDGSTVATEYGERGIMLTSCHIDRVNAWSQVAEVFGSIEHQIKPRCFIHKNCMELVEQIQCAQCDPKKPNDILKMNCDPETLQGGDDFLDGFRNICVMAYSSLISHATPIQMGNYQSQLKERNEDVIDVESVIEESERLELENG